MGALDALAAGGDRVAAAVIVGTGLASTACVCATGWIIGWLVDGRTTGSFSACKPAAGGVLLGGGADWVRTAGAAVLVAGAAETAVVSGMEVCGRALGAGLLGAVVGGGDAGEVCGAGYVL